MAQTTSPNPISLPVQMPRARVSANPTGQNQWQLAWKRFRRNKPAIVGGVIVFIYLMIAVLGPSIAPHDPTQQNSGFDDLPPAWVSQQSSINGKGGDGSFLFGSDSLGRDILSKILYGTRTAVAIGFLPTVLILIFGTAVGFFAGVKGGSTDNALMRITDIFYALPVELMLILLLVTLGDSPLGRVWNGLLLFMCGVAVVSWSGLARLMRGSAMGLRNREFVEASRSMGAGNFYIILKHILPNTLGLIMVWAAFAIPRQIIAEAILGYIGLGLKPAVNLSETSLVTSWGRLFLEGYANVNGNPWFLTLVAITVSILVISFTFLGDGLRDALDPRARTTK